MTPPQNDPPRLNRRALLKSLGVAPMLLRPSPFSASSLLFADPARPSPPGAVPAFADLRLTPHYPARSPLEDVLRLVPPGTDDYIEEKYASEIGLVLSQWSRALSSGESAAIAPSLHPSLAASRLVPATETRLRTGSMQTLRREFPPTVEPGAANFLENLGKWLGRDATVATAEFEITSIQATPHNPTTTLAAELDIRYSLVTGQSDGTRRQQVGSWRTKWSHDTAGGWRLTRLQAASETVGLSRGPGFEDVTRQALGGTPSYAAHLLHGSDHWRTVLDGASGIDVYGNNGVAAGDFDNDGFDDLYISQPAGLPNRLYRNRGDGSLDDVTDRAGVGVLDNTACALFADFRNSGLQDLLVVCGSGPLLFLNQGDGTFALQRDAFQFAQPPLGTFTHAAVADYDRDGRLDIYFCLYSYYLGLDQYHYPVPYYDARNGPPNFLLHNQGDGRFVDRTQASGLHAENDRYSFACAWGESLTSNAPDLYVVNDFGRNNFYRNNGDGTFTAVSTPAHVQDVGAGMSACWTDFDNDGRPDLHVANMWSAAGQRVSMQPRFHQNTPENIRDLYRKHARGNTLYRNQGDGAFQNVTAQAGVEMGRWAWCSDFWDFDHDGYPDLYVTNGYISAPSQQQPSDLGSFFWRQVVANSPDDSTPSLAYEHGWNALNELIRSDNSWSGYERNILYANNRDGTFNEVSGIAGLDFLEDSRSFALADLDHDGRLEVILKNRSSPQLRILHNAFEDLGDSLSFRLRGIRSNRDAIGTAVTLQAGALRQTRYLQAGSGFLAQHSKELFFGIGKHTGPLRATVRWPSGEIQVFEDLPRNSRISLEEGAAAFTAVRFGTTAAIYIRPETPAPAEPPLARVETWLLNPLSAPDFSLPDLSGAMQSLAAYRGHPLVLHLWAAASSQSREQLSLFEKNRQSFAAEHLSLLAINLDNPEAINDARTFATQNRFDFPVLFATEETAGIYNIVVRYLFDRRRDLALPTSFLLDRSGSIVKVYQGTVAPAQLLADARSIPTTDAERIRKALPFPGTLYQGAFARNDFTYGVAMFQHGYLDQAAASFQQVIATRPNDAEGFYNLGTLSLRRNDFSQARTYLEQTLKLKPDYPEAWNNLGMLAAQQGNPDQAIRNFQQSLSLRPTYATALLNLGNVYRRQKDFPNAGRALSRALQLEPDDPEANYSLGMFYAQQDQLDTASTYLQKAVDLRPNYPEAVNNLGVLYVRKQQYPQAEQQFRACIELAPAFDQSYINLARLFVLQHDKEKARQALQNLLQLQPQNTAAKQGLQMLDTMP